jgi:hypothetical protein
MFSVTDSKLSWFLFKVFAALNVIAVVVCVICDLALNSGLSWSYFVISSCLFAVLVSTPAFLMSKRKIVYSLLAVSLLTVPYLKVIEIITAGLWFPKLALPIALASIAAAWLIYVVECFIKANNWHKAGLSVAVVTALNVVVNVTVNTYTGNSLLHISDVISTIACGAVTVLLLLIGLGKIPAKQDVPINDELSKLLHTEESKVEKKEQ